MSKVILFLAGLIFFNTLPAQSYKKTLFVIDSIPLLNDPEEWNQILDEDIADISVIKNEDSLKNLGLSQFDNVTYVFTKLYRNRADSLKKIPSLKQMRMVNDVWNFDGAPYTGKYIDYYNNGKIQDEGTLLNGKVNGEITVYFLNGQIKSVTSYKDGILHGIMKSYFKNGALMQRLEYKDGKADGEWKTYFINGKIEQEKKLKNSTCCDTSIIYYSTGAIKQVRLMKNGAVTPDKKIDDMNYYSTWFNQSLNTGDIKSANKYFFKMLMIDSTGADIHAGRGYLLLREFRFDKAIEEFDKALQIEPLNGWALQYRAIARIRKYQFVNVQSLIKGSNLPLPDVKDMSSIPNSEQEQICNDLEQAYYLDFREYDIKKRLPESILNYCNKRNPR